MMSNRIDFASNGHVDTEAQAPADKGKGRGKGPSKPQAPRKPARPTQGRDRKARGQVTAWAHRYTGAAIVLSAGLNALAAAGGVGVGMLLLSVLHVSEAIVLLTGQHMVLAGLLAVGIDCGLVVSELAAIMVAEGE
jgi:hypothetical protein